MTTGPVGTAYVVIRAITTGLKKDIEDGFDQGVKDANIEKSGEKASEKLGSGFTSGISKQRRSIASSLSGVISRAGDDTDNNTGKRMTALGLSLSKKLGTSMVGDLQSRMKSVNDVIGKGIAKALTGLNLPPIAWIAVLAVPALGGAAKIISAYILGIIAQLGFVVTAAIGAGAAIAGAFVGLGIGILPLFLLLKKQTPVLDAFIFRVGALKTVMNSWAEDIQRRVLPAVGDFLFDVFDALGKPFHSFLQDIADSAAFFIRMASAVLRGDENVGHFTRILDGARQIFDAFGGAIVEIINILLPFFDAAIPLAVQLANAFEAMVTHFSDFIRESSRTGKLGETLQIWYDRSRLIVRALGNLAVGVFNVFKIGADVAQPFFDKLSDITQKFKDFTGSTLGAAQIRIFFQNAIPVMQAVNRLLGDIIKAILEPVLKGNTGGVVDFINFLDQTVLPLVERIARTITKDLTDNLLKFVEAFVRFADVAIKSGALSSFLNTISTVLDILTKILKIPGIGKFVQNFLGLVGGFSALNIVLLGFPEKILASVISGLLQMVSIKYLQIALGLDTTAGGFGALGTALLEVAIPLGIVLAALAVLAVTAIAIWQAMKHWQDIPGWVKAVVIVFGFLISPAIALAFLGRVIFDNWDKLQKVFEDVGKAVASFVTGLPAKLEELGKVVLRFFEKLPGEIGKFFTDTLPKILSDLPDQLGDLGGTLVELITSGLGDLADFGIELMKKIRDAIGDALPGIAEFLGSLPAKIVKLIITGLVEFVGLGTKIVAFIVRGLIKAVPEIATQLINFFKDLPDRVIGSISFISDVGAAIGDGILTGLEKAIPALGKFFFVTLPKKLLDFTVDSGKWLLSTGEKVIGGLLQGIIDGAGDLIGFFGGLPDQLWKALDPGLRGILDDFATWFLDILNDVGGFIDDVIKFFNGLPDKIVTGIGDLLGIVGKFFSDAWDSFKSTVGQFIVDFVNFYLDLPGKIIDKIGDLGGEVIGFLTGEFNDIKDAVVGFLFGDDGIVSKFGGLGDEILKKVSGLGKLIADGISAGFKEAWNAAVQLLNDAIPDLGHVRIPGVSDLIDLFGGDGDLFFVPDNPFNFLKLHTGGLIPGQQGQEVLLKALAGEFVINPAMPTRANALIAQSGLKTETQAVTNITTIVHAEGQADPTMIGIAISKRQRADLFARSVQ